MTELATLTLRPARAEDAPALTTLLRRSWLTTWAPELPFPAVQRFAAEDPAAGYVAGMAADFLVAERAGVLLGMAHAMGDLLAALHVDPRAWGQGVGAALLAAAERRIAEGHAVARLEVLAFNARALRFYRRQGWAEQARRMGDEYGAPVELVEMRKPLPR
ncbi:GNAT family N-acetyltransferase [Pseudoroseomonas cervicalis]|uniref:GNAT family N-acetyltransferase n=1 Tax=Teichococcus cervicalis TaxID=204525 RepID=UPI0022F16269|nr:GNAT family N-acetyltransferase [Pseudoroseomonas cervicalis]WBV43236.1 GNAT family N-acetyltransferase [Pseudoroseomonas cervicalis]